MITAKAPGRVEILGNHTDYNEGYVLLSTVSLQTTVTGEKRLGNQCSVYSANLKDRVEFQVDSLQKDANHAWADYPKGVIQQLQRAGQGLGGFNAEISSTIPFGVGLSSSAALELAFAFFLQGFFLRYGIDAEEPLFHFGRINIYFTVIGFNHGHVVIRIAFPDPESLGVIQRGLEYLLTESGRVFKSGSCGIFS